MRLYQKDNEAKLSTKGTPQDLAVKVILHKANFPFFQSEIGEARLKEDFERR